MSLYDIYDPSSKARAIVTMNPFVNRLVDSVY